MKKYHVNPATGEPGECTATVGSCPYGGRTGLENHYSTMNKAIRAGEAIKKRTSNGRTNHSMIKGRDDKDDMTRLIDKLYDAAREYYQGSGDSGMTDEEYDAGIQYLRTEYEKGNTTDPRVPDLIDGKVAGGTQVMDSTPGKVHHDVPMLSLLKANDRAEVEAYVRRTLAAGATGFKLQAKFDGIACSAVYKDGHLTQMSTRGNGTDGEDMSYLISNPSVKVKGLPEDFTGELAGANIEIRGELFLRPSVFRKINEDRASRGEAAFSNPRNTNAGIVKRAASGGVDKATLQFVMYKIIGDAKEEDLAASGVETASHLTNDEWNKTGIPIPGGSLVIEGSGNVDEATDATMAVVDAFGPVREKTDLSLDGIVIKPVNEKAMDEKMGSGSHHPNSQIAFKYPGATGTTTVRGVTVTVGKSGRVTPTAILDPVEIDGVTISRATMHNYDWAEKKGIAVGSVVQVERRHDVIPAIKAVISTPNGVKPVEPPAECPYCGSRIIDGYCRNGKCPSKGAYMLKTAAGKGALNFDGLGSRMIDALQDSGIVNDVADFYDLTVEDLAGVKVGENTDGTPRRFGEKRAEHVYSYIQASKDLPYHKVLASLSIPDLGAQTAKALTRKFKSIDELHNASLERMAEVEGVGELTARKIRTGLDEQWPMIERLKAAGLQFTEYTEHGPSVITGSMDDDPRRKALTGVKISITGHVPDGWSNRGAWQEFVESMGGEAQPAPKAGTDYLVWDGLKLSSKLVKARKAGVKIISPDDFVNAMGTGVFPDHSTYDENGAYVG